MYNMTHHEQVTLRLGPHENVGCCNPRRKCIQASRVWVHVEAKQSIGSRLAACCRLLQQDVQRASCCHSATALPQSRLLLRLVCFLIVQFDLLGEVAYPIL